MRKVIGFLPDGVRFDYFRRTMRLPERDSLKFEFRVAQSKEDYLSAFRILHDSYVDAGFMERQSNGLRVTPYHCLPGTTTLLALDQGRIVATMAAVKDGPFGLPMQNIFDLSDLKRDGQRLGEVSGLAIHPDYRGHRGQLLFSFVRFIWLHGFHRLGIDQFVITVNPTMVDFYRAYLGFNNLNRSHFVENYDFVRGAPAVGLSADLRHSPTTLRELYENQPGERNIYKFFFESLMNDQYLREPRANFLIPRAAMGPELRRLFLYELSPIWQELSDEQKHKMAQAFEVTRPELIFSDSLAASDRSRNPRVESECPALYGTNVSSIQPDGLGYVSDISRQGFKICLRRNDSLPLTDESRFKIALAPGKTILLRADPVWRIGNTMGFHLSDAPSTWNQFIENAFACASAA